MITCIKNITASIIVQPLLWGVIEKRFDLGSTFYKSLGRHMYEVPASPLIILICTGPSYTYSTDNKETEYFKHDTAQAWKSKA